MPEELTELELERRVGFQRSLNLLLGLLAIVNVFGIIVPTGDSSLVFVQKRD